MEFSGSPDLRFWAGIEGSWGTGWQHTEKSTLIINKWHHVVAIYDGSQMTLYVDNIPTLPNYVSGNITVTSNNLNIGRDPANPTTRFYTGIIDEVRIYNRALNQSEVTELYNIPEPTTILLLAFGTLILQKKKLRNS